jgi:hypothetical protein
LSWHCIAEPRCCRLLLWGRFLWFGRDGIRQPGARRASRASVTVTRTRRRDLSCSSRGWESSRVSSPRRDRLPELTLIAPQCTYKQGVQGCYEECAQTLAGKRKSAEHVHHSHPWPAAELGRIGSFAVDFKSPVADSVVHASDELMLSVAPSGRFRLPSESSSYRVCCRGCTSP